MPRFFALGLLALALCVGVDACGGKSQSDQAVASASGAAGVGGGSAGIGGNSGAGGASSLCPPLAPLPGSACNGTQCCNFSLDSCSSIMSCCNGSVWVESGNTSGASPACSSFSLQSLPADGSSCACMGTLDCRYGGCAESSADGYVSLSCNGASWSVIHTACPASQPCGTSVCQPDLACVISETLSGPVPSCASDPCLAQGRALSCDCAASLCGSYGQCSMQNGAVYCACPTC